MKIKIHETSLTQLAKKLRTSPEECAAWVEEIISDLEDDSSDHPEYRLGENFPLEQVKIISGNLIEHFELEGEVCHISVSSLVYNLVTV